MLKLILNKEVTMKNIKISILSFLFIILLTTKSYAIEAKPSAQSLVLNGNQTPLQGYSIGGYNYFKLRDLAAVLSGNLDFSLKGDAEKITINLSENYKKLSNDLKSIPNKNVSASSKKMNLEILSAGNVKNTSVDCYNISGYNYFKLRDVGELLGLDISYNESSNSAIMTTPIKTSDLISPVISTTPTGKVVLGNERLISEYSNLIDNKNIGLVTNMTGIDSNGVKTYNKLKDYANTNLMALYSPEHGLDGTVTAGKYVSSYTDKNLNLPVYSLYGETREPSSDMLKNIDVLIFDMQDIGSRTYTYISTLNYAMKAASKANIPVVVLDRPNPLGDKVEGFVLEDKYKTFVGVDNLPMAHGMTVGELAKYFNRNINCNLTVVEMKNYNRNMIWQDTGLDFIATSPNIPNIQSAFLYMATGIGEGTGLGQDDKFNFVGSKTLDSKSFAEKLNSYNLPGVTFSPETRGSRNGVRLNISDYKAFNPCLTGTYILATANELTDITVPSESKGVIPMFEKIMGTNKMGKLLKSKASPEEIVNSYQSDLENFKLIRQNYLIYN